MDDNLERHYVFNNYSANQKNFKKYYDMIFNTSRAYEYYKKAYEFTEWVNNPARSDLNKLTPNHISAADKQKYIDYTFQNKNKLIFDGGKYQYSNSNFNRHRTDVIRAAITTNLSTAISGFNKYAKSGADFIMPKISDADWELLENNVCIATFLQGFKLGGKTYNNYSVIPNNYNKTQRKRKKRTNDKRKKIYKLSTHESLI